jgi:hypothetical protein
MSKNSQRRPTPKLKPAPKRVPTSFFMSRTNLADDDDAPPFYDRVCPQKKSDSADSPDFTETINTDLNQ